MARRSYAGAAAALTLASGINATDLTITTSGTATGWPTGSGGKFLVVIARGTASEEKIYVSSRSSNVLTVASTGDRGVDGTGAASHAAGVVVEHCVGAVDLDEANAHVADTTRDDHTQYLNTTRHDVTARHSFGAALGTPAAATTDSQTAASAGSSATAARDDHVHLQPAATARGTLGYTPKTSAYSLTTSTSDITGLTVTVTTVASRRYRVSLFVPLQLGVVTACTVSIQEGATVLAKWDGGNADASSIINHTANASAIITPSAASHTYKATGIYSTGGAGNASVTPAATNPAYILVEDIGI